MRGVEVVGRLRVEELLDRVTDDALACVTVTGALVTLGDITFPIAVFVAPLQLIKID